MNQELSRKRKADYQITGIPKKVINAWDANDVAAFLEATGLTEYADTFTAEQIDGPLLRVLDEDDLGHLGIGSIGSRKKLINALKILDVAEEEAEAEVNSERAAKAEAQRKAKLAGPGSAKGLTFILACSAAAYFGIVSCTGVSSPGTSTTYALDVVAFAWTYLVMAQCVTLVRCLRTGRMGWAIAQLLIVASLVVYAVGASEASADHHRLPVGVAGRPESVLNYLFSPPEQVRAFEVGTVCALLPVSHSFKVGSSTWTFARAAGCRVKLTTGSDMGAAALAAAQAAKGAFSRAFSSWTMD
jgi:hypothetical protein